MSFVERELQLVGSGSMTRKVLLLLAMAFGKVVVMSEISRKDSLMRPPLRDM